MLFCHVCKLVKYICITSNIYIHIYRHLKKKDTSLGPKSEPKFIASMNCGWNQVLAAHGGLSLVCNPHT